MTRYGERNGSVVGSLKNIGFVVLFLTKLILTLLYGVKGRLDLDDDI